MIKKITIYTIILYFIVGNLFPRELGAVNETVNDSATLIADSNLTANKIKQFKIKNINRFLAFYNSPLTQYSEVFVTEAEKNNLDYRLLVAISGVESTFGKAIPTGSYNAWGWNNGNYYFTGWENAISVISTTLNVKYAQNWGAKTPYEIGRYYAASPTWASRVDYFMQDIEKYSANSIDSLEMTI